MLTHWLFLLLCILFIDAGHFDGGTMRWVPLNPYDNSTSTTITIIQSYIWTDLLVICTTDVPISTSGYSNRNQNLTCVGNCSTDGGYSTNPVDILTDCTSSNSIMNVLTSQKSKNVTLAAGAHFSLAYTGSAWPNLTHPPIPNSTWSIVFSVDLRQRPDGFINTPPTANVISPQYAIVNTTIQIQIRVADVNTDDDIRCRWSTKFTIPSIDECGRACYPASMPSGAILSNCTLTLTGPTANTWYAAAIQVEDFINTTSNDSMSSIPVEFLIYVQSQPYCSQAPVFVPFTDCSEASVGVSTSFDILVLNQCDPLVINIADIVATQGISGMTASTLQYSATNASLYYKTFTWTPQANQIGLQQLCLIAYTDENVQSTEYCVTFNVIASSTPCATTTTTSTSTSATTTSTSTSVTSATTQTTTTVSTTTSETTTVTGGGQSTSAPGKTTSWGLIAGISSVALPLALCSCLCLYRLLWSPAAKRRRQAERGEGENTCEYNHPNTSTDSTNRITTPNRAEIPPIEVPNKSYQVYNISPKQNNINREPSTIDSQGSILVSIYNKTNARRANGMSRENTEESLEMGNVWAQPTTSDSINSDTPMSRRSASVRPEVSEGTNLKSSTQNFINSNQITNGENFRSSSTPSFASNRVGSSQSRPETSFQMSQTDRTSSDLKDWSPIYLFGGNSRTETARIQKPS